MNLLQLILAASWGFFLLRLVRAIYHGRLQAVISRPIWLQVILGLVAFTLFGEASERWIDAQFQNKPVALYLRSSALLGLCYLYYLTLRDIHPDADRYRYLHSLGQAVLFILNLSFIAYLLFPQLPLATFRGLIFAFRDTAMGIFVVGAFLPSSGWFWQHEQVNAMKLKL